MRGRFHINMFMAACAFMGSLPVLFSAWIWYDSRINLAADPFVIKAVGQPWQINRSDNFYEVNIRKRRDCRIEVFHVWNGETVRAPSLRRVRATGIFRKQRFPAHPPIWLSPGTATFSAFVRYWCNPWVPQRVESKNSVLVRIVK